MTSDQHGWVGITCPVCGWTSFSPDDVSHRYCAHCHRFHSDMTRDEIDRATAALRRRELRRPGNPVAAWWSAAAIAVLLALRIGVGHASYHAVDVLILAVAWCWAYNAGGRR